MTLAEETAILSAGGGGEREAVHHKSSMNWPVTEYGLAR
jgi:hypothetical protein